MAVKKPIAKRAIAKRAIAKPSPRKVAAKAAAVLAKPKAAAKGAKGNQPNVAQYVNIVRAAAMLMARGRRAIVEALKLMGEDHARSVRVKTGHHEGYMTACVADARTGLPDTVPTDDDKVNAVIILARSKPGTQKPRGDGICQTAQQYKWADDMRHDWSRMLKSAGYPPIKRKVTVAPGAAPRKEELPFKALPKAAAMKAQTPAGAMAGAMQLASALRGYRDANAKLLTQAVKDTMTTCADAIMKAEMPK